MPHINLLPWREEQRKDLKNQFIAVLLMVGVAAAAIWGLLHLYHAQLIQLQNKRIAYVNEKILFLDQQLERIKALDEEKRRLLSRIRTIEQLQRNRPLNVRLFDEIVASLPEGVSLTNLQQRENTIEIIGLAQSNARVSSFMRKISSSKWISNPKLKLIKADEQDKNRLDLHYFQLTFTQFVPKLNEEEG